MAQNVWDQKKSEKLPVVTCAWNNFNQHGTVAMTGPALLKEIAAVQGDMSKKAPVPKGGTCHS